MKIAASNSNESVDCENFSFPPVDGKIALNTTIVETSHRKKVNDSVFRIVNRGNRYSVLNVSALIEVVYGYLAKTE